LVDGGRFEDAPGLVPFLLFEGGFHLLDFFACVLEFGSEGFRCFCVGGQAVSAVMAAAAARIRIGIGRIVGRFRWFLLQGSLRRRSGNTVTRAWETEVHSSNCHRESNCGGRE